MSIWRRIINRAAGATLGGAIGTLVRSLDRRKVDRGGEAGDGTKQVAFTIGVIVLGAKLAKADGRVTRDEISAFKEVFRIPPDEAKNVGRVFDQARKAAHGFEPYAKQISRLFRDNPAVLEELLDGLFHIARADGKVTEDEIAYLREVAQIFGFGDADWDRIRAANVGPDSSDPFTIIGVSRDDSDETIKAAYRKLVVENHPDKLVAQGMPQEFIDVANEKLATINAAYDRIRKERNLN